MAVSAKIAERISTQIKRYQKISLAAKQRDVSESDTVTIINDMLADVLGYDKYREISSEYAIRGTFADLMVIVDNKKRFLVEAKAINVELKDAHVKQAIDYGANEGINWVVLTNGAVWRLYSLKFGKPIDKMLVFEIDALSCDVKSDDVTNCFGSLSSECYSKDVLSDLVAQKQTSSKYTIAAVLRSDAMIEALRREIRRLSGIRLDSEYIGALLEKEIIKRELIDSDQGNEAASYIKKLRRTLERERESNKLPTMTDTPAA